MYVKNKTTNVINEWLDCEVNRCRLANPAWNLEEYTGKVEQGYDGCLYPAGKAPVEPVEHKAATVRAERNWLLNGILWRTERYERQAAADIPTTDDRATYLSICLYLEYLRKIPQQPAFPDVEVLTFEEWSKEK